MLWLNVEALRRVLPHFGCFSKESSDQGFLHGSSTALCDRCDPSGAIFILLGDLRVCTKADCTWYPGSTAIGDCWTQAALPPHNIHVPIDHALFNEEFKIEPSSHLSPQPQCHLNRWFSKVTGICSRAPRDTSAASFPTPSSCDCPIRSTIITIVSADE